MANWCRNYIYLIPQLERLAADYYPRLALSPFLLTNQMAKSLLKLCLFLMNFRLQFYCINVNMVPHKLVVRAGLAVSSFQSLQIIVIFFG